MPDKAKFLFIVTMDVDPAKEALFNEVYDTEHIPFLQKVPGVGRVTRAKGQDFTVAMAGAHHQRKHEGPSYIAIYEIDSPDVVKSEAWGVAVEKGRWPGEVRPHTTNRRQQMFKVTT